MIFLKNIIQSFFESFISDVRIFKEKLFLRTKNLRRKIKRRRVRYLKKFIAKVFRIII